MLLPNVIDAKSNVGNFEVPVLVIASDADRVIPAALVRRVYESATEPKQLLMLTASSHNALTEADLIWWMPVLEWVNGL